MKISTLIERAVDTTLWDGEKPLFTNRQIEAEYSCVAIMLAMENGFYGVIDTGLMNIGLNTMSTTAFHDFPAGPERQYARALWLTWAALMAKEQGL